MDRFRGDSDQGWEDEDRDSDRLIADLQAAKEGAFEELYLRYFDRVYSYLRLAVKDENEAEDVAQQVFMKALETIPKPSFEPRRPLRAWLFIVARNAALDHWRRQSKVQPFEPASLDRRHEEAKAKHGMQSDIDSGADLELRALRWLGDRDLTVLIERLPEAQRQVLFLRYAADFDTAEIAKVLGRKSESVRQLHHRALRFLEGRLAAVGREPFSEGPRRQEMRARAWPGPVRSQHSFTLSAVH